MLSCCISDGADTKSSTTPHLVAGQLQKAGVVLDVVSIGSERDLDLRAISAASGGLYFAPTKLSYALLLTQLEPFLFLSTLFGKVCDEFLSIYLLVWPLSR